MAVATDGRCGVVVIKTTWKNTEWAIYPHNASYGMINPRITTWFATCEMRIRGT
jgi:hypothetical protein